jgi:hypothetical protein
LQVLVDEIVVAGDTATIKGSYAKLTNAIAQIKKGTSKEVPNPSEYSTDYSCS